MALTVTCGILPKQFEKELHRTRGRRDLQLSTLSDINCFSSHSRAESSPSEAEGE